jgi:hypothetical protein
MSGVAGWLNHLKDSADSDFLKGHHIRIPIASCCCCAALSVHWHTRGKKTVTVNLSCAKKLNWTEERLPKNILFLLSSCFRE